MVNRTFNYLTQVTTFILSATIKGGSVIPWFRRSLCLRPHRTGGRVRERTTHVRNPGLSIPPDQDSSSQTRRNDKATPSRRRKNNGSNFGTLLFALLLLILSACGPGASANDSGAAASGDAPASDEAVTLILGAYTTPREAYGETPLPGQVERRAWTRCRL
jgi:hypothetical protein